MKKLACLLICIAPFLDSCSQTDNDILKDFAQFNINGDEQLDGREVTACKCIQYDTNGDKEVSLAEFKAGRKSNTQVDNKTTSRSFFTKKTTGFVAGDKVEILELSKWHPGSIMEVKGDQYKIHYEGFSASFDTWVTKDKLRSIAGKEPKETVQQQPGNMTPTKTGEYYSGFSPGLGQTYLYLLSNGRVVYGCISGGLEYYNVEAGCAKSPSDCGTYSKSGNSISITWKSGEKYTGTLSGRSIENMNGTNFAKLYQVPPTLSANYSSGFTGGGVTAVQSYQFREDGRFILDKVSGYAHGDGRWGAETASNKKGMYKINGYTITLNFDNGANERHTLYALEPNRNPGSLGWDCGFLDKGK